MIIINLSGGSQTLFSVEVTNKDKVSEGGGVAEEGELIKVVEMTVEEAKDYLKKEEVNSPIGLLYGLQWYLSNKIS